MSRMKPSRSARTPISSPAPSHAVRTAGAQRQVRIIGGTWKRRLLPVLSIEGLRPTPDRVRETLFNWLGQDLTGLHCFDMFAGSGALGFEAASRGAEQVVLCEANPKALAQLRSNQSLLGASQIAFLAGDALQRAASLPAHSFDVIFLDPPFGANLLEQSITQAARCLKADGLLYVESESVLPQMGEILGVASPTQPSHWTVLRRGKAGMVNFALLQGAHASGTVRL